VIRSRRVGWAGCAKCIGGGKRNAYMVLVRKSGGRRLLVKTKV
jgi:hypothetical protein